jgi:MFS transporter, MHS family, proline/betaine transporter
MTSPPHRAKKSFSPLALAAGTIGNVLEWYDFGLYGFYAPVVARLFFRSHDPLAALIGAYGGFAVGFAVRPLGGVVFGHLGDRVGRNFVLVMSVAMMGVATTAVAVLPTYASIGIMAPIFLLVVRAFQGFSVDGEFTSSVTYLVETAPAGWRGLAGSFANIGLTLGVLLAVGIAAASVSLAGVEAMSGWAGDRLLRRRTILALVFVAELAMAVASFRLAREGGFAGYAAAQILFGVLFALIMGNTPAMLAELFPRGFRLSGYSVAFNLGIGIAGGTSPLIATWLIAATGDTLAPAFYLMLGASVAGLAVFLTADHSRAPLR